MIKSEVKVRGISIGGTAPITIQSMTNTDTADVGKTLEQIKTLETAGCEIIRLAILDETAAESIKEIRKNTNAALVADIHFDYKLALKCIQNGIDKVRINPGNIGGMSNVKLLADAAKSAKIPIRIGVNGGSLEKDILEKYKSPCAEALAESALNHAKMLEYCGFNDIVLSLKSSNVAEMIKAYQIIDKACNYPLHLGVTEAGTYEMGVVKSSIGIGSLLAQDIGNTIRVSLTDDPVKEVYAAKNILKALGLRNSGVNLISCPTCGRCKMDLISIAKEAEQKLKNVNKNITVAIMGCAVNGPGEAREADIGIAGGCGEGLLFKKGEIIRKIPQGDIVAVLMEEIEKL